MSSDEYRSALNVLNESNEAMRDRQPRVEAQASGLEREGGICPDAVEVHPQKVLMKCRKHPSFTRADKDPNYSPWLCPPSCYQDNWEKCPYREKSDEN